jgi:hypothetical protein
VAQDRRADPTVPATSSRREATLAAARPEPPSVTSPMNLCRRLPVAVRGQQQLSRASTNPSATRRLEVAGTGSGFSARLPRARYCGEAGCHHSSACIHISRQTILKINDTSRAPHSAYLDRMAQQVSATRNPEAREEAVFTRALPLSAARRRDYLNRACRGDRGFRDRIEALLEAHAQAGDLLTPPPAVLYPHPIH